MSYWGFLKSNRDTMVASVASLVSSTTPLALDMWTNIDMTWLKRFLEGAEKLSEQSTFTTLREKVC